MNDYILPFALVSKWVWQVWNRIFPAWKSITS